MMLLGRRGWAVANKGLKMTNGTATDRAYLDQRFDQLLKKFDETDKRIADIENKLKASESGIGESVPPDWQFPWPMTGMMPPAGPWTIWWAWWLSWFVWPFALPLAASGMFPYTSRFAGARVHSWAHWFEAMARMTQQTAGHFGGHSPSKPGDPEVVKKLMAALNQGPLQSLSQEAKSQILWAVRLAQMF
jgi:hypothetical protein